MRAFAFLAATVFLAVQSFAELSIPTSCTQIVAVTAPSWNSSSATLQRWQRDSNRARWAKIGGPVAVLIGERGLGWGLGVHAAPTDDGPRKKEGDRRAPAGVFRLTGAFGSATQAMGRMPWQSITPTLEAVDDPASRFYNQIVDRAKITQPDWRSAEHMAAIPDYALGIVVAHNPQNLRGAGSCIFIHLWRGERRGSAGCTLLREPDLVALLRWLDPARQPMLLQLPREMSPRDLGGF